MSRSHNWRPLQPKVCACGQPASWAYTLMVDGSSEGAQMYCDECKAVKLEEIAAVPKLPRQKNHGQKWSSVGMVTSDTDTSAPYARVMPVGSWNSRMRRFR